jgi:hypothetical protein
MDFDEKEHAHARRVKTFLYVLTVAMILAPVLLYWLIR